MSSLPRDRAPERRAASALGLLASASLLAACATVPNLGPAPQPKAAAALASTQSFTAPAGAWPTDRWWTAYGDAQLDTLIDEALAGSPDLAAAQARVRKAEAAQSSARAPLLPTVGAQGGVVETKQSYNSGIPPAFVPHGWNSAGQVSLNFDYEFDFWGKNRSAVAAAASEARAAEADAAEARLALSTGVASAYADLVRLYAERDVAERSTQVRGQTASLVSDRVTNGADTQAELSQAQAQAATARAELQATDEQIALTKNRIAALLGAGPDRALTIARPSEPSLNPFGLPATLSADLVGRRPDLTAARWRAEAAARRIGVAKAQFYPNVNLAAAIGYQSLGISNLFLSGSSTGQVGPAISLPIFEGGRVQAGFRGARADYDEAVASYDGVLTQALEQVADAATSRKALDGRLTQSREALADNEKAYALALQRYRGGLSNYQSVLLVEDSLLQSRRTVADLQSRAVALDVQLIKALGGGFAAAA